MSSLRRKRRGGFRPPFCPNPKCRAHRQPADWRPTRYGSFVRPRNGRRVPCFRCPLCGRRFSSATFSIRYWLRRPELLRPIAAHASEGPGLRQIARTLGTTHPTVARHLARLGRHCLLFHARLLKDRPLSEPLVIDGFESFEYSQYFPFHANLAVGARSWFLYHFTDSPLRRKGRMTETQRLRRSELEATLGRPDPRAIERAVASLLRPWVERATRKNPLVLHSDDHPAYPRALRRLGCGRVVQHQVTSSKVRRTQRNPLFPVNLTDLLLRHGCANHRRETIAFSKRRQGALERLAVFMVWRNLIKRRSENGPEETAGMAVGVTDRPLEWREILRRRLFPGRIRLPERWRAYYRRRVETRILGMGQAVHACRYAF